MFRGCYVSHIKSDIAMHGIMVGTKTSIHRWPPGPSLGTTVHGPGIRKSRYILKNKSCIM